MTLSAGRTREDAALLAVAAAATVVAAVAVYEARPADVGLWIATAAALGLALAGCFAFWLGGAARRAVDESLFGEWDAARGLLSAIPDGLFVVGDGRIASVNRRLCELVGFEREELLGAAAPFPFWPPEHRHEIEAWHATLGEQDEHVQELTFRRRDGGRVRVLVAGQAVGNGSRYVLTVRDVSARHRRERRLTELSALDPTTGLLEAHQFERRLGDAVRRAIASNANVTLVLAELSIRGRSGPGVFGRPEALVAVEELLGSARASDVIGRTRAAELALLMPDTDLSGGVDGIARLRRTLESVPSVALTAGVCDLASAGNGFALYAFAGRALACARETGIGATNRYTVLPRDVVA